MVDKLNYDGKVVVITGAGSGLGREYALEFASRGAKVVVNDLGGGTDGVGQGKEAADSVVDEIVKAGGTAVPSYDSVEYGAKIIQVAKDSFGKVDVLINNAGISFVTPFEDMSEQEWKKMMAVHLDGSFSCSQAVWRSMRQNGFGRIVFTASPGIYGSVAPSTHYSAAKSAMLGLTRSLAAEGKANNILCNCIIPVAKTRLTESTLPSEVFSKVKPCYVARFLACLCHEKCQENGSFFEVGGGSVNQMRYERNMGIKIAENSYTAEAIYEKWNELTFFEKPTDLGSSEEAVIKQGLDLLKAMADAGIIEPESK